MNNTCMNIMLAKLTPEGTIARYPYDLSDLMSDNPATSFPPLDLLSDTDLADFDVVRVLPSNPPEHNEDTHRPVEQEPVFIEGVWMQQWSIVELPPVSPPNSVTMRQARLALLAVGKLQAVEDAIESLEEPYKTAAKIEWEYSQEVRRDKEFVQMLAPIIGLSESDLDDLFILADTL